MKVLIFIIVLALGLWNGLLESRVEINKQRKLEMEELEEMTKLVEGRRNISAEKLLGERKKKAESRS